MSGCSNAVLLTDLVLFCCFLMSDWLEAVWVSDEERCLYERLQGGQGWKMEAHADTYASIHKDKIQMFHTWTQKLSGPCTVQPLPHHTHTHTSPVFYLTLSPRLISCCTASGCVQIHSLWKWKAAPRCTLSFSLIQLATDSLHAALTHISVEIKDV